MKADLIIVGAGPAGAAAAIQIARRSPELAGRTLLLDGALFPRPKLCGGGVVREADRLLSYLGVITDVPSVTINAIRFEYAGGSSLRRTPRVFRVVRRNEFDACLVRAAQARGVTVHQGAPVRVLRHDTGGVIVATDKREYRARMVIGADGSNSFVRRSLVGGYLPCRFVALDAVTKPPKVDGTDTALFDFRSAAQGIRGYSWAFPCIVGGMAAMNRGLGGSEWPRTRSLKDAFAAWLSAHHIDPRETVIEGATIPVYHPRVKQGADRVVLAGDAVGADPWLGEGISVALGTGIIAANTAIEAFERNEFGLHDYARRLRASAAGWQLRRNRATARSFYAQASRTGIAHWFQSEGSR